MHFSKLFCYLLPYLLGKIFLTFSKWNLELRTDLDSKDRYSCDVSLALLVCNKFKNVTPNLQMGLFSLVPERFLWPLLPNLTMFHLVKLVLRNDLAKAYTLTLCRWKKNTKPNCQCQHRYRKQTFPHFFHLKCLLIFVSFYLMPVPALVHLVQKVMITSNEKYNLSFFVIVR